MMNAAVVERSILDNTTLLWKECLKTIKDNVTQMTYNTWFLPIKPLELNDATLKVQLPSQFFWEWIDEHYNTLINKTIHEVLGPSAKLTYIISEEKDNPVEPETKKEFI